MVSNHGKLWIKIGLIVMDLFIYMLPHESMDQAKNIVQLH
jgi:hypothetical protein